MKWLEEQLMDCKGPFIILACGSMWSDYVSGGKDSWGTFDPEAREKILSLIEKNDIGGVLKFSSRSKGWPSTPRGFQEDLSVNGYWRILSPVAGDFMPHSRALEPGQLSICFTLSSDNSIPIPSQGHKLNIIKQ